MTQTICIEDFCGGGRFPTSFAMDYCPSGQTVYLSGEWGDYETGEPMTIPVSKILSGEYVVTNGGECFREAVERLRKETA